MTAPIASGGGAVSLAEPQRQSLLAIVFLVLRFVRGIGIVQIVLGAGFVLAQSPSLLLVMLGVVVLAAIALGFAALGWWRYTFAVRNGELQVNRGVVSQQTLTVPLDRVQSVSIEQKFLHRIVGLVQVSLDTAGTSEAEFTIDAVDREVAVALQTAAADHKARVTSAASVASAQGDVVGAEVPIMDGGVGVGEVFVPPAPEPVFVERTILQHSPMRIAKIAVTQQPFSGLAVLAPLFAFGDSIIDRIPFDVPELDVGVGRWLLWFVPVAILTVVFFSMLLNIIRVFLSDWNLTITQTASGLRRNAGLLSTTSLASSLPRVQRFEVSQGLIERLVGLHTATLHNIGESDFRVPGCDAVQVAELRELALDDGDGVSVLDRKVSPLEVFKATRNASVVFVALAVGLYFPLSFWSLLFLLAIPLTWLQTRRQVRLRRWGIDADSLADQREFLGWVKNETLLRKVNSVTVRQSLFERKRDLATVSIQLAGGSLGGQSVSIGMIPLSEAMAVRDRALFVAETDTRAFM